MRHSSPSALISDEGRRVLLRIHGRQYELSQPELRNLLGLPAGPPGLGITVDRDRLCFEFAGDERTVVTTGQQLQYWLAKHAHRRA